VWNRRKWVRKVISGIYRYILIIRLYTPRILVFEIISRQHRLDLLSANINNINRIEMANVRLPHQWWAHKSYLCWLFTIIMYACIYVIISLLYAYDSVKKPKRCNTYLWLRPNSILVNTAGAPFDGRDSNTNENVIYYEMTESYAYNKLIITYIQAYMIIVNNQHK
jgi:hypothetical protein